MPTYYLMQGGTEPGTTLRKFQAKSREAALEKIQRLANRTGQDYYLASPKTLRERGAGFLSRLFGNPIQPRSNNPDWIPARAVQLIRDRQGRVKKLRIRR